MTEAVEVSAVGIRLERDSSQRSQVVTAEQAVALPLNGREYSSLMQLTTGVRRSVINSGGPGSTPREGAFTVNGLRSTFNNFLLDGVDNNAYGTSNQGFSNQVMQPPPDAIAEFRVVTNNMSAEYGRSGGGTVNVAYKSGTNRFSGAGWEFRRDTSLNAIGFFRPVAGNEPQLDRDQFGFVLGGPIVKNKAFFFTDYEGFRETQKVVSLASIPTMEQRQGILTIPVRDPRTGATYAAGTPIPMTAFARKVLSELPEPTGPGISNNYRRVRLFETDIDKFNVKLDGRVNDQAVDFRPLRLSRLLHRRRADDAAAVGRQQQRRDLRQQQAARGRRDLHAGRHAVVRVPLRLVVHARRKRSAVARDAERARSLRPAGPADRPARRGRPADADRDGLHATSGVRRRIRSGSIRKCGIRRSTTRSCAAGSRSRWATNSSTCRRKCRTSIRSTGATSTAASSRVRRRPPRTTCTTSSDFYLGLRSGYGLSNILVANLRQNMHFLYVQDDYRVNDKLTLNLGVRYEYATPWWERDNILTNFDPATRTMIAGARRLGRGSLDDQAGPQQLRSAARVRLFAQSGNGDSRRLRHVVRPLPARRRRQRAADQRAAGDQRRRRAARSDGGHRSARRSRAIRRV